MIQNLLQLSVLSLILASAVHSADQPQPCEPTSCANGPNISFPFYIPALQASNCGLPGFELNCTNNFGLPILRILSDNHQYVVENFSYADQILRVYDAALLTFDSNTTCLPKITNTSLPTSQFSFFSAIRLHLFPLCRRIPYTGLGLTRVICSVQDDDQIWNLAIDDDDGHEYLRTAIQSCETHIVAPVDPGADNIYTMLRRGFQLKWTTEGVNLEPPSPSSSPAEVDFLALDAEVDFLAPPPSSPSSSPAEVDFLAPPPSSPSSSPAEVDFLAPPPSSPSSSPAEVDFLAPPPPSLAAVDFLAPPPPVAGEKVKGKGRKWWILVTGVTVGVATVAISFILLIFFKKKLLKLFALEEADANEEAHVELFLRNNGNLAPKRYKYTHLKKITNSFAEKLGKGGFGSVYKGKLEDGCLVAVKILSESKGNGEDFINEVSSISRTSHVNVVTLLGFCFEGLKRALIYEFMPNGSLEKFIPNTSSSAPEVSLGLDKLFEIAVGIARGLEYLHQGCNTRILHFDIKPHNILLDKDLKPKISDFGQAKLCPNRSSIVSMQGVRGTVGYIAPEVFCRNFGDVSHKSDVYSYGMMVLEMVVGKQNNIDTQGGRSSETNFSDWIYKQLEHNTMEKCVINNNVLQDGKENLVKRKLIIIGLWCIQTNPLDRPSISKVIEMLEGKLESLPIPPRPYLSSTPISQQMFSNL